MTKEAKMWRWGKGVERLMVGVVSPIDDLT
jgi:hypothetical protein